MAPKVSARDVHFLRRFPFPSHTFITSSRPSHILASDGPMEEEQHPGYNAKYFYPVDLGDFPQNRYKI